MIRARIDSGATARIQARLRALPDQISGPIRAATQAAGTETLSRVQRRAPVEHGDLKSGITITRTEFGFQISVLAIARRGRQRFNYAWFVEFGTHRAIEVTFSLGKSGRLRRRRKVTVGRGARPFLFPAFRFMKRKYKPAIGRAIRGALGIVAKRG